MPSSRDPEVTYRLRPMEPDDERTLLARRLPKAEMHMHHMGSLSPAQLAHLHKQWTGTALDARDADAAYDNRGVGKFFDDLDKAVRLWKDEAALVAGALHMIYAAYDRGVRHLELLCTPDLHRQQLGMEPEEMLRGVAAIARYTARSSPSSWARRSISSRSAGMAGMPSRDRGSRQIML
jgi:hypothetical protein